MTPRNINFLIVDDYKTITNMVTKFLKDEGFHGEFFTAANGKEALELLDQKEIKIDFIISDYQMPEMDGAALLRKIREDSRYENTPFLMLTAIKNAANIIASLLSGVTNYLIKPWSPKALIEKIDVCWEEQFKKDEEEAS